MDINLLVINVGNSRLALGVFVAGTLEFSTRIPLSQRADWPGKIADAWGRIADTEQPAVAGASVNHDLDATIQQIVTQQTGQSIQWVGRELDLPIKVNTHPPTDTGVDRILNIAAAYEQMQKACIVVDAGSAITVDLCNDAGEFLGGAILPGVNMMLDALHDKTGALPRITFATPEGPIGDSTEQALRHGAFHAVRGLVKELAEQYATELGAWPEIIATGGDAPALFDHWELIHAIAPDLTLYGIALAYAEHHIRHKT